MTIRPIRLRSSSTGSSAHSRAKGFTSSCAYKPNVRGTVRTRSARSHQANVNQPLIAVGFACGRLPASAPSKPCTHANTSLSAATGLSKCGPQMPNSLIPAGWTKLAEWTTDEDAAAKHSKPQPVQTVPQPGSMEWFEAQKKKD